MEFDDLPVRDQVRRVQDLRARWYTNRMIADLCGLGSPQRVSQFNVMSCLFDCHEGNEILTYIENHTIGFDRVYKFIRSVKDDPEDLRKRLRQLAGEAQKCAKLGKTIARGFRVNGKGDGRKRTSRRVP